jgi:hypothetical protein
MSHTVCIPIPLSLANFVANCSFSNFSINFSFVLLPVQFSYIFQPFYLGSPSDNYHFHRIDAQYNITIDCKVLISEKDQAHLASPPFTTMTIGTNFCTSPLILTVKHKKKTTGTVRPNLL